MFWRRALPVLLLAVLPGCSEERILPTAPVVQATPTPAPTPTPAVADVPAPSLEHDWWFRADGSFCVTNHSGNMTRFEACARKVYPGGDQDFAQTDAIVAGGWIPDGDTFCGQLPLFGCYTEMELVEQPNTCNDFKQITGARYLNVGQYCARAPTPTPRSVPTPSPSPTPTPAPSPTPCAVVPSVLAQSIASSPATFAALATVTGSGAWSLAIYATSNLSEYEANQPDYVKATDTATTACGTTAALEASYSWQGHSSRYWWADLKLNGARVWKSAAVEHATQ